MRCYAPLVHLWRERGRLPQRGVEVAARDRPHVRVDGDRAHLVERKESDAVGHLRPHAAQRAQRRAHLRQRRAAAQPVQPLGAAHLEQQLRRLQHVRRAVAEAEPAQLGLACRGQRLDAREGVEALAAIAAIGAGVRVAASRCVQLNLRAVLPTQRLQHGADARDVIIRRAYEREEALHRLLAQHAHAGQRARDRRHPRVGGGPSAVQRRQRVRQLEEIAQLVAHGVYRAGRAGGRSNAAELAVCARLPQLEHARTQHAHPDVNVGAAPPAEALTIGERLLEPQLGGRNFQRRPRAQRAQRLEAHTTMSPVAKKFTVDFRDISQCTICGTTAEQRVASLPWGACSSRNFLKHVCAAD